ncbi:translin-associated protein X, partial [Tanacetum coccineum]
IGKNNKDEVLKKAEKDLSAFRDQQIAWLIQESVKAATLCKLCTTGNLLNLEELNSMLLPLSDPSFEPFQINILDYVLGLADLTGELMRLAIGRISDGELEYAQKICRITREIYRELTLVAPKMDDSSDMKSKMDVMLQSCKPPALLPQATQPAVVPSAAQPAVVPSAGPNANPLDLFPQGLPDMGANAPAGAPGNLDFLRYIALRYFTKRKLHVGSCKEDIKISRILIR